MIKKTIFLILGAIFLCISAYFGIYFFQNSLDFPEHRACSKDEFITTAQMQEKFKYRLFSGRDKYNGMALLGHDIHIALDKNLPKNKIIFLPNQGKLGNSHEEETIIISNGQLLSKINCTDLDNSMAIHFLPDKIEVINYIDQERVVFDRF